MKPGLLHIQTSQKIKHKIPRLESTSINIVFCHTGNKKNACSTYTVAFKTKKYRAILKDFSTFYRGVRSMQQSKMPPLLLKYPMTSPFSFSFSIVSAMSMGC